MRGMPKSDDGYLEVLYDIYLRAIGGRFADWLRKMADNAEGWHE